MKKVIVILFVITVVILSLDSKDQVIIPEESIRFRIIASSNEIEDVSNKLNVKKEVEDILLAINNVTNIDETRNQINEVIPEIETKINSLGLTADINYGYNYFPTKEYKNIIYKEGMYESLVITLGKGTGNNWWCVLFPPLCKIEENNDNYTEKEYGLYIKNIIDKF